MATARERFSELAGRPDAEIDVAEAALWIAAEADPSVDVAIYLGKLDLLAEEAARVLAPADSDVARIARLNEFMFERKRFVGNRTTYEDPRNSFLNQVLDRRTGIPITLALVYMEVARRLGLRVEGVGFPGHFLARHPGPPPILIDAFHGRVLLREDCEEMLRRLFGESAHLEPEHLAAAGPREILVRMLRNLKQALIRESRLEAALGCCDRILLLEPADAAELRDRGLVYRKLECFGAAIADLERSLELGPEQSGADAVRELLPDLRRRAAQIH